MASSAKRAPVEPASGEVLRVSQWRALHPGQPVARLGWADWCPICRTEEHSITRLQRDWPVLTVAMQSGDPADVAKVLAERGLHWPTVVDEDGAITARYGHAGVPALAVIDAEGQLRSVAVGYTTALGMHLRLWWAKVVTG